MMKIKIRDLNHSGEGVGLVDKKVTFVPGLLPQEEALIRLTEIKRRYQRGEIVEITKASPHKIQGACPHEKDCGGCPLINMNYEAEFSWKKSFVESSFKKMARLEIEIEDLYPAKEIFHYRNKITFFLEEGKLGLRRAGSRELAPIDACRLGKKEFDSFYPLFEGRRDLHSVILRKADKGVMVILLGEKSIEDKKFLDSLEKAGSLSIYQSIEKKNQRALSGRLVLLRGEKTLDFTVMDRVFSLTPRSFFQVNSDQADVLYKLAKDYLDPKEDERLLDLYAGQGTLGAYMADSMEEVIGVEVVQEAVREGSKNLPSNMKLIQARVEDIELPQVDALIVDPPRAGLKPSVVEDILRIKPKKIVYVACNPVTQARDIALLEGYEVKRVGLVDMFPNTAHVECIALLQREIM